MREVFLIFDLKRTLFLYCRVNNFPRIVPSSRIEEGFSAKTLLEDKIHPPEIICQLHQLKLDEQTLTSIHFHKHLLKKELKSRAKHNKCLKSHEIFQAILSAHIEGLDYNNAKSIVSIYNPTNKEISYTEFLHNFLIDVNSLLKKRGPSMESSQIINGYKSGIDPVTDTKRTLNNYIDFEEVRSEMRVIKTALQHIKQQVIIL